MRLNYIPGRATWTFYEGEEAEAEAKAKAEAEAKEAEAKAKEGDANKTFTQEQVNKMLAEDRRKHKAQVDKHVTELEQLKKSKSLSDNERQNLTSKIEELQNSVLTKEQRAQKEQEKLKKDLEQTTQQLTADRDGWKERFHTTQIKQAITSEAAAHKAFDSDALIAILGPNTRLVEVQDDAGNPTGEFVPKTKFKDKDPKEGKDVVLDMTVPEVVARMKEIPKYGYLFETTAAAGVGAGRQAGGRGGEVDPSTMTTSQYREWRKKEGLK
jgi:predicted RNase H-like nuclease (RuvC/YqgF family)